MPSPPDLARLYDEHAQALFAYLLDLTGSEADAKDLLQDVFVRIAGTPEMLAGVSGERSFLVRVARNSVIDLSRRRGARDRKHERLGEEWIGFAAERDPDEKAFQAALESSVAELPVEQREVVHLKAWGGLTFQEIAEALEISPNTAASRYRYALDKLRTLLRPLYDEIK